VIARGDLYLVDLGAAEGSKPARHRPVLVVQADVFLPASATGLPRDSVGNVTALVTLDKDDLVEPAGSVPSYVMADIDRGLRHVLDV